MTNKIKRTHKPTCQRGSALLAVLWLSAALSAIAFSVASRVRAETERASTTAEGTRAYFLATGAIDRAILWMYWGMYYNTRNPDGTPRYYQAPMPFLNFNMPAGTAVVEVVPEAGKLNVNTANPGDLQRLLEVLGIDPVRAAQITMGIVEWRSGTGGTPGPSIGFTGGSTFRPRRASLEELEEILLVPAMTPDIFYGRYDHDAAGRLIPRGGLRDCLTVWGQNGKIDVNTAPMALLQSVGVPPEVAKHIVSRRIASPFMKIDEVSALIPDPSVVSRLGINGSSIYTLRATARARTPNSRASDLRRTVGAVVKLLDPSKFDPPFHILRWYDEAWSPASSGY